MKYNNLEETFTPKFMSSVQIYKKLFIKMNLTDKKCYKSITDNEDLQVLAQDTFSEYYEYITKFNITILDIDEFKILYFIATELYEKHNEPEILVLFIAIVEMQIKPAKMNKNIKRKLISSIMSGNLFQLYGRYGLYQIMLQYYEESQKPDVDLNLDF